MPIRLKRRMTATFASVKCTSRPKYMAMTMPMNTQRYMMKRPWVRGGQDGRGEIPRYVRDTLGTCAPSASSVRISSGEHDAASSGPSFADECSGSGEAEYSRAQEYEAAALYGSLVVRSRSLRSG